MQFTEHQQPPSTYFWPVGFGYVQFGQWTARMQVHLHLVDQDRSSSLGGQAGDDLKVGILHST